MKDVSEGLNERMCSPACYTSEFSKREIKLKTERPNSLVHSQKCRDRAALQEDTTTMQLHEHQDKGSPEVELIVSKLKAATFVPEFDIKQTCALFYKASFDLARACCLDEGSSADWAGGFIHNLLLLL